jgi:3',5'-nucleoside bisphosphate phosphatase
MMRLDLHIHTTASDGSWSPEAVVRGAAEGGLDVISITDHDTVAGVARAVAEAREVDVQVVPGIEVSSSHGGQDVHVLGYWVDVDEPSLVAYAARAERRREERMREMVHRLGASGVHVPFEAVERAAGPDRGVIGRPHLAASLVEAGYASSVSDAFQRLIGDHSDAFVPTALLGPVEAVELLRAVGGVPVWAHPPSELMEELLGPMCEAGLRGLEVYRARGRKTDVVRLEAICEERGLVRSGGSDWHTPDYGSKLGDFWVGADEVAGLLAVGGL